MYLYNLTLQRASGCQTAIYGNFSAPKAQEIAVSRGKAIDLLRPDDNGKMQTVLSTEIFGQVRSLAVFRLAGASKDYLVVGSDSGKITVVEYVKEKNKFEIVHQETFGKSGCRRIVPGQYLVADPKGRACMIAACEKQKLVYVFNRDSSSALTISSPLEAHKSHTLVFSICAVDCGFDNPVFAAIELDYAKADEDSTGEVVAEVQKHLTYYELDLGLNHMVRKWSQATDNGANMVVTVPGGADGPSGVLICAENFVIYKNQNHEDVRAVIPRRSDLPGDRGVLIVATAVHKLKSGFFFLLQSEYGDIYKATLKYESGAEMDTVHELIIKYFDTIPPCASICVLKTGFLFAASEFGNHTLYQFQGIGDDPEDVESSSANLMETDDGFSPVFFDPRPLKNIVPIDEMSSLSPVMDLKSLALPGEETPALVAACGRGTRSSLRLLRQGLALTEMAVSPLPGNPNAVWTVKRKADEEFDAFIVVSFVNATLVLSIGETVEEVNDSGFLGTTPSLLVAQIGEDSLVQAHPTGLRHIRADKRINEWKTPGRKNVVKVAANQRQVVLGLSGGEVIYFEMDMTGLLEEVEKKELSADISSLALGEVPEGRQRARFLAVGSFDNTVRILSMDPGSVLQVLAVQAVPNTPESLLILDIASAADAAAKGEDGEGMEGSGVGGQFLNIGLQNGVLLRTEVDRVTGQLTDTRTRFLGHKSPKLFSTTVRGQQAMVALSTRPWLAYSDGGRFVLAPLSYETLEYASSFASDQCPEGIVAVAGNTLRIVTVERLGEVFNQTACKLRYTPRKFCVHPDTQNIVVAQCDAAVASTDAGINARNAAAAAKKASKAAMDVDGDDGIVIKKSDEDEESDEDEDEEEAGMTPEEQFGAQRSGEGQWASCVQMVDPASATVLQHIELDDNEAALSCCAVAFEGQPTSFIAVATVQSLSFYPRQAQGGFIHLYRVAASDDPEKPARLLLVHKTPVQGIVGAMTAFQGKLAVGVDATLRLYDLGKKKLLRKCECKGFPSFIVTINHCADRMYVGDNQHSFCYVKYRAAENTMYVVADDICPRWITCALHLDYDTMAAGDKFGNIVITRLPQEMSEEVEADPTGGKMMAHQQALTGGAANKVEHIMQFHVGEVVTSLHKVVMQPTAGGAEVILYATTNGTVGALLPFQTREDVDLISHLEMHMRQDHPPLCGRDHMAFRSYYFPVKDVMDGDLCEQFAQLSPEQQRKIADELERTPSEILMRLEDLRSKICM